jgi:gamma-glutamylcyclotransferase (GGCT)/AIG2-like uncharacterized protein YtfP
LIHQLYFAYGSNMDPRQMARRCPGAVSPGTGVLAGHRFVINRRGYATVVPAGGHVVHGVMWRLEAGHEEALDRYENVAVGLYTKETLRIELADGRVCEALCYVAADPETGKPREGYLEKVIHGARYFGLPAEYLAGLETWF